MRSAMAENISTIEFNSAVYNSVIQKINKHNFVFFTSGWQMVLDENTPIQDITIPVLLPQETDIAIFQKSFIIPDSLKNFDLRIWILGIQGSAEIKYNGYLLNNHTNISTSFFIDVPRHLLLPGRKNQLEIQIRKPSEISEAIPNFVNLFSPTTPLSILREVYLEWIPPISFSELNYQSVNDQLEYSYRLQIKNSDLIKSPPEKIRIEEVIFDPSGNKIFNHFEYINLEEVNKSFNRRTAIKEPLLWHPASPFLYTIELRLFTRSGLKASYSKKIGIRFIRISGGQILLNEKPLYIKGITYREVYDNKILSTQSSEFYNRLKTDFKAIKNLGFNALRFPHAVPHPYAAYLADSLGLFLFIENGIWRVPSDFFVQDEFLQNSKKIATEIMQTFYLHPSFIALGLGQEIPIHIPAVQKFILILKEYLKQKYRVFVYLSPINDKHYTPGSLVDFYMINKYDTKILSDVENFNSGRWPMLNVPFIFGNIGFAVHSTGIGNEIDWEKQQVSKIQESLVLINSIKNLDGFFIESFRDWQAEFSSSVTEKITGNRYIYPYGMISHTGRQRTIYSIISGMLNQNYVQIQDIIGKDKQNNFFSITVFISSVIVLLIYRRNFRLRENIKRSFAHPYGFYVDLRDRRIISIFNSVLTGLYTNLLVSIIIAAFCYYYHDNLLFEEYFSYIFFPFGMMNFYLSIFSTPWLLVIWIWLSFYLLQLLVVIVLKIINLFSKNRLRLRQILAICNWAGLPLIFLAPVSLLSYHLLQSENYKIYIIIIMVIFFLWYNYRLANGMRVLFMIRGYKVFIIMILTYCLVLSIFGAFFESKYYMLSYFKLLTMAGNLF